jgi:uncharacterized protein YbjT (DUF2867 family)
MRIVIPGGTGQVGQVLVPALRAPATTLLYSAEARDQAWGL